MMKNAKLVHLMNYYLWCRGCHFFVIYIRIKVRNKGLPDKIPLSYRFKSTTLIATGKFYQNLIFRLDWIMKPADIHIFLKKHESKKIKTMSHYF